MSAGNQADDSAHAPADDQQELVKEIAQDRERLGDVVEQLAAKTDVKQRVAKQARKQTERLRGTASRVTKQAAQRAGQARDQLAGTTRDPLPDWAGQLKGATAGESRQRAIALAAAAVFALIACILLLRWRADR